MRPLLSICIPTYNHGHYLIDLLLHLKEFENFLPLTEIVISNNASTDNTLEILQNFENSLIHHPKLRLKYVTQRFNIDSLENLESAYRSASGKYCLNLSDDDRLRPDVVKKHLDTLEKNENLIAVFAPFVERIPGHGDLYTAPFKEEAILSKSDPTKFLNFILSTRCILENGIVKTECMHSAYTSVTIYEANKYTDVFPTLLSQGDILITPESFYIYIPFRNIEEEDLDGRLHYEYLNKSPDNVSFGFEIMASKLLDLVKAQELPAEEKRNLLQAIKDVSLFSDQYYMRAHVHQKNYIKANLLFRRLRLWSYKIEPDKYEAMHNLIILTIIQGIEASIHNCNYIEAVIFAGFKNPSPFTKILQERNPFLKTSIIKNINNLKYNENLAVVVPIEKNRPRALEAGFKNGFIYSFEQMQKLYEPYPIQINYDDL